MTTYAERIEEVEFLARSEIRVRVLNRVAAVGTATRRELRDDLDASRTTVKRNLDALVERGWLRNTGRKYTITPCGEYIATEFGELVEAIRIVRELEPFMEWVEANDFAFDLGELVDAEIVVANGGDPYAPVNKHVETLQTADEVRALLPSVGHEAMKVSVERIREADPEYEMVVEPDCAETLQTDPQYAPLLDVAITAGAVELFLYEGEFPYYLGILDSTVQIGAEDDDGIPRALLETESDTVREWAERTFTEYRSEAVPITDDQQARYA